MQLPWCSASCFQEINLYWIVSGRYTYITCIYKCYCVLWIKFCLYFFFKIVFCAPHFIVKLHHCLVNDCRGCGFQQWIRIHRSNWAKGMIRQEAFEITLAASLSQSLYSNMITDRIASQLLFRILFSFLLLILQIQFPLCTIEQASGHTRISYTFYTY